MVPLKDRLISRKKVVPDKVCASFKDGILEVRIQKSEEAKRKEIKIKVE